MRVEPSSRLVAEHGLVGWRHRAIVRRMLQHAAIRVARTLDITARHTRICQTITGVDGRGERNCAEPELRESVARRLPDQRIAACPVDVARIQNPDGWKRRTQRIGTGQDEVERLWLNQCPPHRCGRCSGDGQQPRANQRRRNVGARRHAAGEHSSQKRTNRLQT